MDALAVFTRNLSEIDAATEIAKSSFRRAEMRHKMKMRIAELYAAQMVGCIHTNDDFSGEFWYEMLSKIRA